MTREEIIQLANEALVCQQIWIDQPDCMELESVILFAQLVAAAEREACAKECEHTAVRMGSEWMAHHCAEAIRARGQQ